MATNLKHAIEALTNLQCRLIEEENETSLALENIITAMTAHEAEHGWINQRLNMLVEIYNLVGADGSQCIDRIKSNFKKAKIMQDALSEIYEYVTGKAQDVARLTLEKL